MTTRQRYLLSASIFAFLILVVLGTLALLPRQGVSELTFSRIKKGMTTKEVEEILGRPRTEPICFGFNDILITRAEWIGSNEDGDEVRIVIEYEGERGQETVYKGVRDIIVPLPVPMSERLRRILPGF